MAEAGGELIGRNHPLWNAYKHHFKLSFSDVLDYGNSPFRLRGVTLSSDQSKALTDEMDDQFKLLTNLDLSWRELLPGVIVAAVMWQLLQYFGGFYVDHELKRTGPLYGVFALVLGLLAWLYLGAQLTIFAAEVNVVKVRRLWPRSFFSDPLSEADRRALTASAEVEERVDEENVEVSFARSGERRPE